MTQAQAMHDAEVAIRTWDAGDSSLQRLVALNGKVCLLSRKCKADNATTICLITGPDLRHGLGSSKWNVIAHVIRELIKKGTL